MTDDSFFGLKSIIIVGIGVFYIVIEMNEKDGWLPDSRVLVITRIQFALFFCYPFLTQLQYDVLWNDFLVESCECCREVLAAQRCQGRDRSRKVRQGWCRFSCLRAPERKCAKRRRLRFKMITSALHPAALMTVLPLMVHHSFSIFYRQLQICKSVGKLFTVFPPIKCPSLSFKRQLSQFGEHRIRSVDTKLYDVNYCQNENI